MDRERKRDQKFEGLYRRSATLEHYYWSTYYIANATKHIF